MRFAADIAVSYDLIEIIDAIPSRTDVKIGYAGTGLEEIKQVIHRSIGVEERMGAARRPARHSDHVSGIVDTKGFAE